MLLSEHKKAARGTQGCIVDEDCGKKCENPAQLRIWTPDVCVQTEETGELQKSPQKQCAYD